MSTSASIAASGKPEQGPFYDLDGQALPAAGAFTNQGYAAIPPDTRRVSVIVTYTASASAVGAGQAALKPQWKIAASESERSIVDVVETAADPTITKSGNVLTQSGYALQFNGPNAAAGVTISYRLLLVAPPFAIGVRLLAAEVGDTAHPGTVTTRVYSSTHL